MQHNDDSRLDLHDIQGNIIKAYGKIRLHKARFIFYKVKDELEGRDFITKVIKLITSAAIWDDNIGMDKPIVTTNIAFTYHGLKQLGVPRQSLQSFPDEFAMGMKARSVILGDNQESAPDQWDPIWNSHESVDILISINAITEYEINKRFDEIQELVKKNQSGIELLSGHVGEHPDYQDASVLYKDNNPMQPIPKEHFGYIDGIINPYFKGTKVNPADVIGGGKPTGKDPATYDGWEALETGEFILGHRDEAHEYPVAPLPRLLSFNGTFMVYRKLHQNIGSFNRYLKQTGAEFPEGREALAAKFTGRWRNGAPMATHPNESDANALADKLAQFSKLRAQATTTQEKQKLQTEYLKLRKLLAGYNYNNDLHGAGCPLAAHTRRVNPRGSLEFGVKNAYNTPGALVNRRRILRRGMPYGRVENSDEDNGNHGIIFMGLNASIKRQFEFVQQQWVNYGNDFKQANDKDPILGNHGLDKHGVADGRMVIEADPESNKVPFFCSNIPRFVETRGGDYFFIPSLTALHMIGQGIIDPT